MRYIFLQYILLIVVAVTFFVSCGTTLYTSNTVNTPLLKKKGEIKLAAGTNDFQSSLAAGEHLAIMTNGFYKAYNASNNYSHKGSLLEAGLGYFNSLKKNLICEIYAGAGKGNIYKRQTLLADDKSTMIACFNVNASKYFIQPDIGYCGKYFDIAFASRFTMVTYNHFISYNYDPEKLREDDLDQLNGKSYYFLEPAFTVRGGLPFLKLQLQIGKSFKLNNAPLKYSAAFAYVGLVADIN